MTIRDRTREIGTVRAIGMKQNDVKYIFILEVVYLVVVGWIVGLVLSFIVMKLLSLITFGADNPFNMFMVDRHLYFITTIGNLVKNLVIVIVFALVTAYFPARQAAKLKPAEALSHFH